MHSKTDLENLSDNHLLDIIVNYKNYNYDEYYKILALEVLKDRYGENFQLILSNIKIDGKSNLKAELLILYKKFIFSFWINIISFFSIFIFSPFIINIQSNVSIYNIISDIISIFICFSFIVSLFLGVKYKNKFDKKYDQYLGINEKENISFLSKRRRFMFLLIIDFLDIRVKKESL